MVKPYLKIREIKKVVSKIKKYIYRYESVFKLRKLYKKRKKLKEKKIIKSKKNRQKQLT